MDTAGNNIPCVMFSTSNIFKGYSRRRRFHTTPPNAGLILDGRNQYIMQNEGDIWDRNFTSVDINMCLRNFWTLCYSLFFHAPLFLNFPDSNSLTSCTYKSMDRSFAMVMHIERTLFWHKNRLGNGKKKKQKDYDCVHLRLPRLTIWIQQQKAYLRHIVTHGV